jgi:hypothetical protein
LLQQIKEVPAVQARHTAMRDEASDGALRLRGATKAGWKGRVAAVFPETGDYANDAPRSADAAARDVSIGGIGELMTQDYSAAFAN